MVAQGRVENGVVVLTGGIRWPEGQQVTVLAPSMALPKTHSVLDIPPVMPVPLPKVPSEWVDELETIIDQGRRTSGPNNEEHSDRTDIVMPAGEWQVFCEALESPPRGIPMLRKLFTEVDVFADEKLDGKKKAASSVVRKSAKDIRPASAGDLNRLREAMRGPVDTSDIPEQKRSRGRRRQSGK